MNRTIIECEWRSWEFHEQWNWAHIVCSSTNEFHVNWFFLSLASVHCFSCCVLCVQASRLSCVKLIASMSRDGKLFRGCSSLLICVKKKNKIERSQPEQISTHHRLEVYKQIKWRQKASRTPSVTSRVKTRIYVWRKNETHSTAARNKPWADPLMMRPTATMTMVRKRQNTHNKKVKFSFLKRNIKYNEI